LAQKSDYLSAPELVRKIEHMFGAKPLAVASAPGRMDFLNTHQDYKGLPVVPIAVNLRTYVALLRRRSGSFKVHSLTLKESGAEYTDEFETTDLRTRGRGWFGDYLRSVIVSLQRMGIRPRSEGGEIIIDSSVPIASGLASSAALEVAFCTFLNHYWGLQLSPPEIAEACFVAENSVMGIPCGRLDQYSAAIGGAILLYPFPPVKYESLPLVRCVFVAVDSGIRHSVKEIHPVRQREINVGLEQILEKEIPPELRARLAKHYASVAWDQIKYGELEPILREVEEKPAKRIAYTLLANESTSRIVEALRTGLATLDLLAHVINEQHELLRDLYDVSTPEMERIREAMLTNGALGVKISGAGLGGCLIGICRDERDAWRALEAAKAAGATRGWTLSIDKGCSLDHVA
jgi:galactokinase